MKPLTMIVKKRVLTLRDTKDVDQSRTQVSKERCIMPSGVGNSDNN